MSRFLLDMPVSALLLDVLHEHGHEGVHAHQIGKDRATDRELLEIARREQRVVITADLDFPQLLALSRRGTRFDPVRIDRRRRGPRGRDRRLGSAGLQAGSWIAAWRAVSYRGSVGRTCQGAGT